MKRTREIYVVVTKDWIEKTRGIGHISEDPNFTTTLNGKETITGKLVIELPERSAKISEGDLAKAIERVRGRINAPAMSGQYLSESEFSSMIFDELDQQP